jgi:hypothetical protein
MIERDEYQPPADAISGSPRNPQISWGEVEALARCLLPAIRSYFESDEGQREFAEWQTRQDTEQATGGEVKADEQVRLTA